MIGKGWWSVVWEAESKLTGECIAVKEVGVRNPMASMHNIYKRLQFGASCGHLYDIFDCMV